MGCFNYSKLISTTAAIGFIDWLDASQATEIHYLVSTGLRKFYDTTQTGIDVVITECFVESCERWLSSAVARRHTVNLPLVVQRRRDTCNLWVWSCYQMKSSEDKMNMLVHCH